MGAPPQARKRAPGAIAAPTTAVEKLRTLPDHFNETQKTPHQDGATTSSGPATGRAGGPTESPQGKVMHESIGLTEWAMTHHA